MIASDTLLPLMVSPFVGSYLGVLTARLPEGRTVIWGRSCCASCSATLGAIDLVPIASWLVLRGRCRRCGAGIGLDPLMIELAAVAAAIWASLVLSGWLIWAGCILGWMLLALAFIDRQHFILPDELTLPLIPAGLAVVGLIDIKNLADHVIGACAGFLAVWGLAMAYAHLRGREGIGLGDAKLLAAGGAWVSWIGLPSVLLIAAISALLVVALKCVRSTTPHRFEAVAFGPHLALAIWIVWLYGPLVLE